MLMLYAKDPTGIVLAAKRCPDDMPGDQLVEAMEDFAVMMADAPECDLLYKYFDDSSMEADLIIDAEYSGLRQAMQEIENHKGERGRHEERHSKAPGKMRDDEVYIAACREVLR